MITRMESSSCGREKITYSITDDGKKSLMAQMMVAVLVISSGTVAWYDGIWQIGMLLPIILIYFYNGESGKKNIVNKWSFYLFYPIHFLALWLYLKA